MIVHMIMTRIPHEVKEGLMITSAYTGNHGFSEAVIEING